MSSSRQPHSSAGQSSQKKRKNLDRFIPHSVARNLFGAPTDTCKHSQYESLLNQNLISQQSKILYFHDQ